LFENKDKGKRFKNETFYYFLFKTFCITFDPMNCLECGKEVPQTKGRRERLFCNNTCKSKYWRKNKKSDGMVPAMGPGRPKKSAAETPLSDEVLKGFVVTTTPQVFDAPKIDTLADEPKMWQEGEPNPPYKFTPAVIYDVNGKAMTEEEISNAMNALHHVYPSDYNELLRMAKAGVNNQVAFRKHVENTKLTPGQKGMIYSKLKKDIPKQ
jgi:hypothetical protein